MSKAISRQEAKDEIVAREYEMLLDYEKMKILERDYSFLDEPEHLQSYLEEGDLPELNDTAIRLIQSGKYLRLPFDESLKPIFVESLYQDLLGATNEYLELLLNNNKTQFVVHGEIDKRGKCPCCEYYSIDYGEEGLWDICRVCFWENGGDGPNHMPLAKAQENFKRWGAMSKSALRFVEPEGRVKYYKNSSA